MIRLASPLWLWLALPWAFLLLAVAQSQSRALAWLRDHVAPRRLGSLTAYAERPLALHLLWLWFIGLFVIVAAAGPFVTGRSVATQESRDIIIVIDSSLSMDVDDVHGDKTNKQATRFEWGREFAVELVEALPASRFGLISFSGQAMIHSPITVDREAVLTQLRALRPHRVIVSNGSEFGSALGAIVHLWRDRQSPVQVVLISDGDVSPDPRPFDGELAALRALGVPVHTFGVGSTRTQYRVIWDPKDVVANTPEKQRKPAVEYTTRRDDATLERIAKATGGTAFVMTNHTAADVVPVIAKIPPRQIAIDEVGRRDVSRWFLVVALLLFGLEARVFRRTLVALCVLLACGAGCGEDTIYANQLNEAGRQQFADKQWSAAERKFEEAGALRVRPHIPMYNVAMTELAERRYGQAHRALEDALELDPQFNQALFADGAVFYAWGGEAIDDAKCRYDETRERWQHAIERFGQAGGPRALANQRFVEAELAALAEREKKCKAKAAAQAQAPQPQQPQPQQQQPQPQQPQPQQPQPQQPQPQQAQQQRQQAHAGSPQPAEPKPEPGQAGSAPAAPEPKLTDDEQQKLEAATAGARGKSTGQTWRQTRASQGRQGDVEKTRGPSIKW